MDPVGPWSAYASYNRLAGVQPGSGSGELHHHLATTGAAGAQPTTTAQILPGSFLSPPPVGYETVFSPLFHHAGAKPAAAHYVTQVTQHRAQALAQAQAAASKQTGDGEYHQAQAFFEQGATAWQQNSPFGILPHESVVATTTNKTAAYENFNAHFAAAQSLNHLNSQLAAANTKNPTTRAQSPQVTTSSSKQTPANSATFFQVPTTFTGSDSAAENKPFSSSNASNIQQQQSCIVSSPPNTSTTKEYRIQQSSTRTAYLNTPNLPRTIEKPFAPPIKQPLQTPPQIQTKAQTKIYPELSNQADRRSAEENQSQSSPISFSIMDVPGRMNYAGSNASAKRPPFQHSNYRHYQPGTNVESDYQRPKSNSDYNNTNGPDCNVVIPRRPSPLQSNSQASPLGHAPSPAYPMYNSPMNSISSPQQNSTNQVTPPSPLDVSVPRPNSQTNSVAYPSVITRALNSEKNFPERYERPAQNQNCWDESRQRKFQAQTNAQNNYNNSDINARQIDGGVQRNVGGATERQQAYFDSGHQVTLQDLSSCRGDPMSIVKNLQQQQSCQVQQVEVKQEAKVTVNKRRKSNEKNQAAVPTEMTGSSMEYFSGRIPPPAHSTGANQQQQNGGYFDFDRWNLPPPASKILGSQMIHQQHQGLMVPHPHTHHPPPPLPYFPPFHLTPHPPEFSSTVELTPISTYNNESNPQQQPQAQFVQQEEQPKVVVPNIEEELNFLSEGSTVRPPATGPRPPNTIVPLKTDKPTGPAGFMNSYLKFLQGERDSSPPPPSRGNRKTSWSRQTKPIQQVEIKPDSNGVKPAPPPPAPVTRLSQGDPQDDPRYFPLPKERKRRSFDSSDDGFSSDDDLFNSKMPPIKNETTKEKAGKKGRPSKSGSTTERKRTKQKSQDKKEDEYNSSGAISTDNLPRRETSKRAAKEKINMKQLMAKGDDDLEEPAEFVDSDSDPAWTPLARDDADEELPISKKSRRGRPTGSRKKKNLITAAAQGAGIQETDGYSSDSLSAHSKKSKSGSKQQKQTGPPTLEDNIAAAVAMQNSTPPILADESPFKPGEFVVIKSELNQEWPAIWRVDGKTLLQKYEPFEQNGQILYRNISTYTSWTPESRKQYIPVPVRFKGQSQLETIVEFLRSELLIIDHDFVDRVMKESEAFQDNFEVYIQTLISQALDSNFLTEIFQEKDEYFLSNVKTIDDITNSKKNKLLVLLKWPKPVQAAVTTWPCFNIIREVSAVDMQMRSCAACLQQGVAVRVLMYGQPYNSTTLEGCQPDPQAVNEKDFLMCRICADRVELFNKITHQKYLMYIECAKRVAEKRTTESHKDTTCILNELLADENWLNQLFLEVRSSWAEVDSLEHSYKMKNLKSA